MSKIVIFGASGDLTRRKLIPALYNLWLRGKLDNIRIIGMARTKYTTTDWLKHLTQGQDPSKWAEFAKCLSYIAGDATSDDLPKGALYYLAIPSTFYEAVASRIKEVNPGAKLILEKPFGTDLVTARQLNTELQRYFCEQQLFRIDHYLGKDTVQNLLVFQELTSPQD